jgi:hypothetical protein
MTDNEIDYHERNAHDPAVLDLVAALRATRAALRVFARGDGHFDKQCGLARIDREGPEPFDCGLDFCKAARAALGEA